MRVLKFGGTSLGHAQRLDTVAERVASARREMPVVVVVSALGGVTDELARALEAAERGEPTPGLVRRLRARHLEDPSSRLDELTAKTLAAELDPWLRELERLLDGVSRLGEAPVGARHSVLATGERLSAPRVVAWLRSSGVSATVVDGTTVLRADCDLGHCQAGAPRIDQRSTRRQVLTGLDALTRGEVPVVTGFLAADAQGRTVTLGRGASDLSATTLAAALEADLVEIWTDTDGVFSADPRRVPSSRPLRHLSFDQAAALARYGAKVLHPETLAPVSTIALPIELRSTFQPELPGTRIAEPPESQVDGASAAAPAEARLGQEPVFAGQADGEGAARAVSTLPVVGLELSATAVVPLGSTALGVLERLRIEPLRFHRTRGLVSLWLQPGDAEAVEVELRRQARPLRATVDRHDNLTALALLPASLPAAWLLGDLARLLSARGFAVHDLFIDPGQAGGWQQRGPRGRGVVVAVIDHSAADMALVAVHDALVAAVPAGVSWAAAG